jgi:diguanylate cyclase (GGDEF)-like protein/putative nucleotidyltransferase with HDIG domain
MRDLSKKAQLYVWGMIALGLFLLTKNLLTFNWGNSWMLLVLSIASSLSLIFKVEGSTNRSHYNVSFLVYAFTFILYGPTSTIFVILISNLVDWFWHKYAWYIQLFNIASYIVVIELTGKIYESTNPGYQVGSWNNVLAILFAMAAFTLLNHLFIGIVIWLARNENFVTSGIFNLFPLMFDFILLCMGAGTAILWTFNPIASVLVLLPLYLIYTTLKVPALERRSELDAKTGLFNASYFQRALENELKRANRFDRPLTMVMGDLDLLRNINNTYGHLAGDKVLIGVANILKNSLREYDVVARFGGEEYAILIPEITPEEACDRIETIRSMIAAAEFTVQTSVSPIKATISFGISGRKGFNQTPHDIIHNADTALYHAKLSGRNGTCIFSVDQANNQLAHEDLLREDLLREDESRDTEASTRILAGAVANAVPLKTPLPDIKPGAREKELHPQPHAKPSPKWVLNLFIAGLAVVAIGFFSLSNPVFQNLDWSGLILFSAMVVLTELLSIDLFIRENSVSTSAVPVLAGILLFGPVGAVVLSFVFAIVAFVKHRSSFNRLIFNISNQMIAGLIYTLLIARIGIPFTELNEVFQCMISLGAICIVYLSTTFTIAIAIGLDRGVSIRTIWKDQFSWLAPYYFAMGLVAYGLIFSYQKAGIFGTLVILVPLLLLRFSQKQYIDRTRNIVQQLREKNLALETSASEINDLNDGLLSALAEIVDLRDPQVGGHSKQVARYGSIMAKRLGLSGRQVDLIYKAGMLHDIGKIGISESILFKPDKLNAGEYESIQQHVTLGADILQATHVLHELIPIIRHHHEQYDGSGYPDHLIGSEIPLEARILAVADAVEAMASDRPYRKGLNWIAIIAELRKNAGAQFDPAVVQAFIEATQSRSQEVMISLAENLELGASTD